MKYPVTRVRIEREHQLSEEMELLLLNQSAARTYAACREIMTELVDDLEQGKVPTTWLSNHVQEFRTALLTLNLLADRVDAVYLRLNIWGDTRCCAAGHTALGSDNGMLLGVSVEGLPLPATELGPQEDIDYWMQREAETKRGHKKATASIRNEEKSDEEKPDTRLRFQTPYLSTEADVWVDMWEETIAQHPEIPTDRDTMRTWFANAIMVGYHAGSVKEKQE